jgi:hypothetical protein
VLFTVEQRLTHINLVSLIGASRVELEADVTLVLGLRVVRGEVVIGLESLIMCIDLLDVWSCLLQVEIYKTLESFVYVINSKQYFWSLILRREISIRIIKRRILSGLRPTNQQPPLLSLISQITKLICGLGREVLIICTSLIIPHKLIIEKLWLGRFIGTYTVIILRFWGITLLGRPLLSVFHHFIVVSLCSLSWWLPEITMVHILKEG